MSKKLNRNGGKKSQKIRQKSIHMAPKKLKKQVPHKIAQKFSRK